jgi:hypothetical protein
MEQELRDYREPGRPPRLSLRTLAIVLVGVLAAGTLMAVVGWIAFAIWFAYRMRNFN